MKKNISFHDTENQLVYIKIELENGRFSMSGDCGQSSGQCQDNIKPTKTQKPLIVIWNEHHLNNLHAGTPEQEEALKKCKSHDYKDQVSFLKSKRLYQVTLKDGTKYKYGTDWLTWELPKDLWSEIEKICSEIEADEEKRKASFKGGNWEDLSREIQALGKYLEMTPKEAGENIEESPYNSNVYDAEGRSYYVGTDEEIKDICVEYLTDDTSLYQCWVEDQIKNGSASFIKNIDDWAEWVIDLDGYGSVLNHWDGSEHYDEDLKLYVIQQ